MAAGLLSWCHSVMFILQQLARQIENRIKIRLIRYVQREQQVSLHQQIGLKGHHLGQNPAFADIDNKTLDTLTLRIDRHLGLGKIISLIFSPIARIANGVNLFNQIRRSHAHHHYVLKALRISSLMSVPLSLFGENNTGRIPVVIGFGHFRIKLG